MNGSKRRIGLVSASSLVVGNMIGTGVFVASGFALADLGSRGAVLLAWVLGGLLATLGALSYGALALRFPQSGGEYEFLARTWHPLLGFLAGWVSLLVGFSAPIAIAAAALARYLGPAVGLDLGTEVVGTLAILMGGAVHFAGVRIGTRVQDAVVACKVLLLVALIVGGAVAILVRGIPPAPATTSLAPSTFAVSLVWIYFAYSGWNATVYVGGEVRDPQRNLPRSLLLGTLVVLVIYVGLNGVFLYAAPAAELVGKPAIGLVAGRALGGDLLGRGVAVLVVMALFTSVSAMVMAGPRVYERMAQDGVFPAIFVGGDGPPRAAIALQVILALAFLWTSTFEGLMTYVGFTLGLSSAITVAGLFLLHRREGRGSIRLPGYPIVPGIYVASVITISVFTFPTRLVEASLGIGTLLAGLPLYFWFRRSSASR